MSTAIQLTVRGLIPITNNRLLRMHWAKLARLNKTWAHQVGLAMLASGIKGEQWEKVEVWIEVHHSNNWILDKDNEWGAMKPVLDAIVRNGLIWDDNREVIVLQHVAHSRVKTKADEMTMIRIEKRGD